STPLWSGPGIASSAAATDPVHGPAAMINDNGHGGLILSSLDGLVVGINDIIVKYALNGDVDLNGVIDADDYFVIDQGFASQGPGSPVPVYRSGDIDYNGQVDADDYFLVDGAFASQNSIPVAASQINTGATQPAPNAGQEAQDNVPAQNVTAPL